MSVSSKIDDESFDDELQFPINYYDDDAGEAFTTMSIRVLLVDSDFNSLRLMHNLLTQFSYRVTSFSNGDEAITFLMKGKHKIDLVIWDFHVNGLEALNTIRKDMDLPLVIMSRDHDMETVMKSTKYGACDFLGKPVSQQVIAVLWRHVYIKRMSKSGLDQSNEPSSVESNPKEEEEEDGLRHDNNSYEDNTSDQKRKRRFVWTPKLHQAFEAAVEKIGGLEKAVPSLILKCMQERMNFEGLTRANIASHLQKYRQTAKKKLNVCPETREDYGRLNIGPNSNMNLHNGVPYYMNGEAAANAVIQYPSSSYRATTNNGHLMTNHLANHLPYIDPFHQPQQQQQQYDHSCLQFPSVVNTQEPGHVLSSAMENLDLIYSPTLFFDPNEFLPPRNNQSDRST